LCPGAEAGNDLKGPLDAIEFAWLRDRLCQMAVKFALAAQATVTAFSQNDF
jgi:hypothetical protein